MKMNEKERKWFQKLQRRHNNWHRTRWVALGGGLLVTAGGIYNIMNLVWNYSESTIDNAMLWAFEVPECWLLIFTGCGLAGIAIARWKGHPMTKLTLRLVDEHMEKDAEDGKN